MPMSIIVVMLVLAQGDIPAVTQEEQSTTPVYRGEHDPMPAEVEAPTSRALLRILLVPGTLPEPGGATAA